MIAVVLGFLIGTAAGGLAGYVVYRGRLCPEPDAHELTDDDREAVAAEFAAHAAAVQRQVSEYADILAGGDTQLRQRLRIFEGGERP